ncbi:ABC transporter ATP-binding protein [Nocardioides zhouii]|jgi:peptide/nickel transport system ATP-binding protein|uniref:Dipeptide ABC transporter ATP-binding protein n=1 Tax=Nocardioides zhouii TaxID=1168729 RepID=A0A4Q2SJ86_9ACTN|nr:ABC transporter ATP-binding protein [Nocardioides zhouii]RYC05626.1 dipeptide ABC transporter ATP-binding protein [Nocardioides zhouii]
MNDHSIGSEVLVLRGLSVCLSTGDPVVEDVDLTLHAGEILGVVGESGSGKTTTALSLLGYSTPGTFIAAGQLRIEGKALHMDESMRPMRGSIISYVPQDPAQALNPSLKVAAALKDVLGAHGTPRPGNNAAEDALRRVGFGQAKTVASRFPHQISGGQQQRVSIALALCREPAVVILDEPTTGLDVVTQAQILAELRRLRTEQGVAMVYVTHDLAAVSEVADRIAVMYAGRVVEEGPAEQVLRNPRHPYTRGLLASIPDHVRPRVLEPMPGIAVGVGERPSGCPFAPRCPQRTDDCVAEMPTLEPIGDTRRVRCIHHRKTPPVRTFSVETLPRPSEIGEQPLLMIGDLKAEHRSHREVTVAAEQISFDVNKGECVALVGESGSGKTTILRTIAGLHPIAGGRVLLDGHALPSLVNHRSREQRRRIQLIFQNPAAALNPRQTVAEAIARPAQVLRKLDRRSLPAEVARLLECVRLPVRLANRYPHELSGGERQRVAVARALAAQPDILLCDEITSALDVSVQAAVLQLLLDLRDDFGLGLLFITHDLGVVATIADTVLVLDRGSIVDRGPTRDVLRAPTSDYTRRLLAAAPTVSRTPSSANDPFPVSL